MKTAAMAKALVKAHEKEAFATAKRSLQADTADLDFFADSLRLLRDKMILLNGVGGAAAIGLKTLNAALTAYDTYTGCVEKHFELTDGELTPKGGVEKDAAMKAFHAERQLYFGVFCDLVKENMPFWRIYHNDSL